MNFIDNFSVVHQILNFSALLMLLSLQCINLGVFRFSKNPELSWGHWLIFFLHHLLVTRPGPALFSWIILFDQPILTLVVVADVFFEGELKLWLKTGLIRAGQASLACTGWCSITLHETGCLSFVYFVVFFFLLMNVIFFIFWFISFPVKVILFVWHGRG